MFQYDMLARSLASGNGFRWYATADLARIAPYLHVDISTLNLDPRGVITTFRAPLYPGFLSIVYLINGINDDRFFAARLVQTILGALLAPMTYFVSLNIFPNTGSSKISVEENKLSPPKKIASIAAWIVAVYPTILLYPLALATENLFFLLVIGSVLSLLILARVSSGSSSNLTLFYSLLSGFMLGLAALTRSVILPFSFLAILWIWSILKLPKRAILTTLALVITISPWIIRNSLIAHKVTGIETSMGYNLYVGYYPSSTGTFTFGPSLDLLSILDDQVRDELGTRRALEFISQDPARFPYLAVRRLGYFFNMELRAFTYFYVNNFFGSITDPLLILILLLLAVPFVFVTLSATFGAISMPLTPQTILFALLLIGYLVPHIFILSEERFHLTLIPYLGICASNFWVKGFNLLKKQRTLLLVIAGFVALFLIINWGFELIGEGPILAQILGPNGNQLYLPY